ncbi:MAG: prepilin peptidase [Planctomycetota bacterium]
MESSQAEDKLATRPESATALDGSQLFDEYLRIGSIGTAACAGFFWLMHIGRSPSSWLMVFGCVVAIVVHVIPARFHLPRLVLLISCVGLVAMSAASTSDGTASIPFFSPVVLIGLLVLLMLRDMLIAIRKHAKAISPGRIVIVGSVLALVIYMIVIPSVDAFLEQFRERPQSYVIEELSPMEVLRIRSAKLAVFAIFAYAGACVGSFLNVVAASAPRGESIALRSSACPECGTPIRRIDNLPIMSYLMLRGRCRDCEAAIPIRYFAVELVGFTIFGSLFVYELVTGAANVPGFQSYTYAGILWIILYTKWPVVGIYLLHCLLFSCVLMLALMERDRLRPPRKMAITLLVLFAGVVIAIPTMLTVSLVDQTPFQLPTSFPSWLDRAATCIAGGISGWMIGQLMMSLSRRHGQDSSLLAAALVLLGVSLGWQAVLTIAITWLIVTVIFNFLDRARIRTQWLSGSTLLLMLAMLHHPLWKWLSGHLTF